MTWDPDLDGPNASGDHVHPCPECFERKPCEDTCTIVGDLSEPGQPSGSHATCDDCLARQHPGDANAPMPLDALPGLLAAARRAWDLLGTYGEMVTDAACEWCNGRAPQEATGYHTFEYTGPVVHRDDCEYATLGAAIAKAEGRSCR